MQPEILQDGNCELWNMTSKNILRAGVKQQAAEVLSRLKTGRRDDSDIGAGISVMTVTTRARSRRNKLVDTTPEEILNETQEPTPPTFE